VVQQARQCASVAHLIVPILLISPADRVQRLKDARTEANKEIEEYRRVKEQEFTAFQSSVGPFHLFPTLLLVY
jgi:hypothetical protein